MTITKQLRDDWQRLESRYRQERWAGKGGAMTITRQEAARTAALLRRAAELLDGGKRWTRGALARDEQGAGVRINAPEAASFCLGGALGRALHDLAPAPANNADVFEAFANRDRAAERWSAFFVRERIKARREHAWFLTTTFNDEQDSYGPIGEVLAEAAEEAERLAAAP